jgi:hypothetical protein
MVLIRPMRTKRARVSERRIAQVSVERRRRLDAMRSSCETDGKRSDESVELLIYKEFGGYSRGN